MTSKLKPLILPQLVQDRSNTPRKYDDVVCTVEAVETGNGTPMFLGDNASVSDITSPATPTFSQRSGLGHLRYASSTSSLDLPLSLPSPSYPECTSAPAAALGLGLLPAVSAVPAVPAISTVPAGAAVPSASNASTPKRPLPDVQEEDPFEQFSENAQHDTVYDTDGTQQEDYREDDREDDREDIEAMILAHRISDLYDCLCDEPCTHGRASREPAYVNGQRFEYDMGLVSESDKASTPPPLVGRLRRRTNGGSVSALSDAAHSAHTGHAGHDTSLSNLTQRIGSHINVIARWRSGSTSSRRAYGHLAAAPVSDSSLSRAPSSRASSLSTGRPALAELFHPTPNPTPVIAAPSLSRYGSTDSIEQFPTTTGAMDDDDELEDVRQSIERDRTKATTPLLPPLFTSAPHPPASPLPPPSMHASPHQAPQAFLAPQAAQVPQAAQAPQAPQAPQAAASPVAVADAGIPPMSLASPTSPLLSHPSSPLTVVTPTDVLPSPPLNRKLSTASFQHGHPGHNHHGHPGHNHLGSLGSLGSNAPALAPQDAWADRLGHANQTISPLPYHLRDSAGPAEFHQLCDDWAQARTNYAKHLVRMGEHYGTTSNIYVLTKAKWAETEWQWKAAHAEAYARTAADSGACAAPPLPPCQHQDVSAVIPQIVDAEGKFPHRGDDEIVGPMDRVERDNAPRHARGGMSRFLRGLAGRVRMRR